MDAALVGPLFQYGNEASAPGTAGVCCATLVGDRAEGLRRLRVLVFGGCSGGGQHPEEHATVRGVVAMSIRYTSATEPS